MGEELFCREEELLLQEVTCINVEAPCDEVSSLSRLPRGKSTLLNKLFQTNFREMDAIKGRSQTTAGIWIAKCVGIEPCTIVMDLEGCDGRERGELVKPSFRVVRRHLCSTAFEKFTIDLDRSLIDGRGFAAAVRYCTQNSLLQFDQDYSGLNVKHANWDASHSRGKLRLDIENHAASIRSAKLTELIAYYKKQLTEELAEPIQSCFDNAEQSTWASVRELYNRALKTTHSEVTNTLSGFEVDSTYFQSLEMDLKRHARDVVENICRQKVRGILIHLKERFSYVFNHDNDSLPRVWTSNENVKRIMHDSRAAALKVLSIFVAIRLDEKPDNIENILKSALIDIQATKESENMTVSDPLTSNLWDDISQANTLISPAECKSLWKNFIEESNMIVVERLSIQKNLERYNPTRHSPWNSPWNYATLVCAGFLVYMMIRR